MAYSFDQQSTSLFLTTDQEGILKIPQSETPFKPAFIQREVNYDKSSILQVDWSSDTHVPMTNLHEEGPGHMRSNLIKRSRDPFTFKDLDFRNLSSHQKQTRLKKFKPDRFNAVGDSISLSSVIRFSTDFNSVTLIRFDRNLLDKLKPRELQLVGAAEHLVNYHPEIPQNFTQLFQHRGHFAVSGLVKEIRLFINRLVAAERSLQASLPAIEIDDESNLYDLFIHDNEITLNSSDIVSRSKTQNLLYKQISEWASGKNISRSNAYALYVTLPASEDVNHHRDARRVQEFLRSLFIEPRVLNKEQIKEDVEDEAERLAHEGQEGIKEELGELFEEKENQQMAEQAKIERGILKENALNFDAMVNAAGLSLDIEPIEEHLRGLVSPEVERLIQLHKPLIQEGLLIDGHVLNENVRAELLEPFMDNIANIMSRDINDQNEIDSIEYMRASFNSIMNVLMSDPEEPIFVSLLSTRPNGPEFEKLMKEIQTDIKQQFAHSVTYPSFKNGNVLLFENLRGNVNIQRNYNFGAFVGEHFGEVSADVLEYLEANDDIKFNYDFTEKAIKTGVPRNQHVVNNDFSKMADTMYRDSEDDPRRPEKIREGVEAQIPVIAKQHQLDRAQLLFPVGVDKQNGFDVPKIIQTSWVNILTRLLQPNFPGRILNTIHAKFNTYDELTPREKMKPTNKRMANTVWILQFLFVFFKQANANILQQNILNIALAEPSHASTQNHLNLSNGIISRYLLNNPQFEWDKEVLEDLNEEVNKRERFIDQHISEGDVVMDELEEKE